MPAISICSLLLACVPSQDPVAAPRPLDARWIDGIGSVEIASSARGHLSIRTADSAGVAHARDVELREVGPEADIVAAQASSFMKEGVIVAVTATAGGTTTYHELHIGRLADAPDHAVANDPSRPANRFGWVFTTPIFSSTGERYRVLDLHNPGGDTIEITYRRGLVVDPNTYKPQLDEKIYFNVCPGSNPTALPALLIELPAGLGKK
jgi:hypothetical protein